MIKEAAYYEKLPGGKVVCRLCPAGCKLTEGKVGICKGRFNRSGILMTDNYGELVSIAIDPIEKKPLYHFHPTTEILSTGPNGCNMACVHCQNWTISQRKTRTTYVSPESLVKEAVRHDLIGVAFTYTEPMIWYEYLMDVAPLLHQADLKVVLVTNGYINAEPLADLLEYVDAVNVDLKGIRRKFYLRMCKGRIEPVLDNIKTMVRAGIHVELTNLIIPGKNDSDEDLTDLVEFVASISDRIPLHFSVYHPDYKLDIPATPAETMLRAREIARKRLKYVFVGNIALPGCSDSVCPECGNILIRRSGFSTSVVGVSDGVCSKCGYQTGIVQ